LYLYANSKNEDPRKEASENNIVRARNSSLIEKVLWSVDELEIFVDDTDD